MTEVSADVRVYQFIGNLWAEPGKGGVGLKPPVHPVNDGGREFVLARYGTFLLLQFLEVAVLALLGFSRGFDELQELLERFPLETGDVKAHADTETRVALNHDPVEDQPLDPNFAARNP